MLESDRIYKCLLSSVNSISVPLLDVSVADIVSFEIEGFDDPSVQKLTDVTLDVFREVILENMGRVFNFSIRTMLNNWIEYILAQESSTACVSTARSLVTSGATVVDFRELLLPPPESIELGGTGEKQYGDIIRNITDLVNDDILKIDPATGLSSINSLLISEITEAQSNVSGRLIFPGDLFTGGKRVKIGGLDLQIDIRVQDAYFNNLDTIGYPVSLLDPVVNQPSYLNNTARIGVRDPLQLGARFYLHISGSGQEIENEIDAELSMAELSMVLTALLRLSEDRFLTFPVRDLVSTDCLLSMIPAPELDSHGIRLESEEKSAGLLRLVVSTVLMQLKINCVGVCSPGMPKLSELLSTIEGIEASTKFGNEAFNYLTSSVLGGNYLQVSFGTPTFRNPPLPIEVTDWNSLFNTAGCN
jgi:hypothetical protein